MLLGDGGCAGPHTLDGSECRPRDEVADQRGEQQGRRAADEEFAAQVRERLVAGAKRRADDQDQLLLLRSKGRGEQPHVASESVCACDEECSGLCPAEQGAREERLLIEAGALVADCAAAVENLGETAGRVGDGGGWRLA